MNKKTVFTIVLSTAIVLTGCQAIKATPVLVPAQTSVSSGSSQLEAKFWNPVVGEYTPWPWFKDAGDNDPSNLNPTIQSVNAGRIAQGFAPLQMADLSSSNPARPGEKGYVDLSAPIPWGQGPKVTGFRFAGWLCSGEECSEGIPLYAPMEHKACDGTNIACDANQYCYITSTVGLPKGVCLLPGEVAP